MKPFADLEVWVNGLLNASLQAALLVPVILLIQWLLRGRLAARWRHALWWLLLARLLLPVSIASPFSLFNYVQATFVVAGPELAAPLTPRAQSTAGQEIQFSEADPRARVGEELVERRQTVPPVASVAGEPNVGRERGRAMPALAPDVPVRNSAPSFTWDDYLIPAIAGAWLLGVVVLASIVFAQTVRFSRKLRRSAQSQSAALAPLLVASRQAMGLARAVELIETDAVSSPVLYGLFRLRILVPASFAERFTADELRHVLLHELAHAKRGDLWLNWLVTFLQIVHWFNPVIWLGLARQRADRELACDELALVKAGASSGGEYGRTILKLLEDFARPSAVPGLVGILEDRQQMKRRIQMIAQFKTPSRWSALAALLIVGLGLVTLTDAQLDKPAATPATAAVAPPAAPDFTTLDLRAFYDQPPLSDFDGPSIWEAFPKGDQTFAGIPFSARGIIQLYGTTSDRGMGKAFRKAVDDVPVNRAFERLHVLHATAFIATNGTLLAIIQLNYADGSSAVLPMVYGQHAKDGWRAKHEPPVQLEPNSRLAWSGTHPESIRYGKTLREFVTSYPNPHPERVVASVSLRSNSQTANEVIVAITAGRALTGAEIAAVPRVYEPQDVKNAAVVFKVVRGEALNPAAGVVLKAGGRESGSGVDLGEYVTGRDGTTAIQYGSTMDSLWVTPTGPGLTPVRVTWDVQRGNKVPAEYVLTLRPAVTIGGVVRDETGQPIANATISVSLPNESPPQFNAVEQIALYDRSVATDADGRWTFAEFPAEAKAVSVRVTHPEFSSGSFLSDTAPSMYVGERLPMADLSIGTAEMKLKAGVELTGVVTDEAGRPVRDAQVALGRTRYDSDRKPATTDGNGAFRLTGVTAGESWLTVQANGFAPAMKKLAAGTANAPLQFKLGAGHTYTGRITDPDGKPLNGARVSVERWNGTQLLEATANTDTEGRYRLESLPASGVEFYLGRSGFMQMRNIRPSSAIPENNYTLKPAVKITGRVTDAATGEPIKEFTVTPGDAWMANVGPSNWQDYASRRGADGQFVHAIEELNQGIVLKIVATGYLPQITKRLTAEDGGQTIELALKKGTGPRGVVVTANGQPAAGAVVALGSRSAPVSVDPKNGIMTGNQAGRFAQVTTDAQGRFELPPEADAVLLVATSPAGFAELPVDATDASAEHRLTLQALGSVTGRLAAPGYDKVGQEIHMQSAAQGNGGGLNFGWGVSKVTTDAEGRFTMSDVLPGKRQLVWMLKTTENSWQHALTKEVEIKPGETVHVEMTLEGRPVIGRAQLSDPKRAVKWNHANIQIEQLRPPAGLSSQKDFEAWQASPEYKEWQKRFRHYAVIVKDDGSFRSLPVPPGEYQLNLQAVDPETTDENGFSGQSLGYLNRPIVVPQGSTEAPVDLGTVIVKLIEPLKVGMAAPDFSALDANGQAFSLANFRGRQTLLTFDGANDLTEVPMEHRAMLQKLLDLQNRATASGKLSIVNLVTEKDAARQAELMTAHNLPFVLGIVSAEQFGELSQSYQRSGIILIGADGRISHILGHTTPDQMVAQLESALSP